MIIDFDDHYVDLRPSTVCDGVGVFSIRDIPRGTEIFKHCPRDTYYSWSRVDNPEVQRLIERICYCDEEGFYAAGHLSTLGMAYYVNHSDAPNIELRDDGGYYALQRIGSDEELLMRYNPNEKDWT